MPGSQVQQAKLAEEKANSQESRTRRDMAWVLEKRQAEMDEAAAHEQAAVEQVCARALVSPCSMCPNVVCEQLSSLPHGSHGERPSVILKVCAPFWPLALVLSWAGAGAPVGCTGETGRGNLSID